MRRLALAPLAAVLLLAACGDAEPSTGGADTTGAAVTTPDTLATKPSVDLPAELPTELQITDLIDGSGPEAAVGDTVVVNYVGVRSADGVEFDNSYDRGQPYDVLIGAGNVIEGWDTGLVGVRAGMRRQLDIPASMAYGDQGAGDTIRPGDAITFIIDVVAVLPTSDAADEPQVEVKPADNVEVIAITELVDGTGPAPTEGDTVAIRLIAYDAQTGEKLDSTWGAPPLVFAWTVDTDAYRGLVAAVKDMKVGGRRLVQIPFMLMFDGQGNAQLGLPASIDLTVVVDLVAVY